MKPVEKAHVLMTPTPYPPAPTDFLQHQSKLIYDSYQHWTGKALMRSDIPADALANALYHADFALLAHDARPDPVFNYANLAAQQLFKMDWPTMTRLASRHSAEPMQQQDRAAFLQQVARHGYVGDYAGVRIASDGQRFRIEQAIVWNLLDEHGEHRGQAAIIPCWQWL